MCQTIELVAFSPAITNRPVMSGNHCTRAEYDHDSGDRSRSLPSSTENPTTLLLPPIVATVAATIFPSGDQDGPVKKIGEKRCGLFFTARLRSPLPSTFAITSALSPGFG